MFSMLNFYPKMMGYSGGGGGGGGSGGGGGAGGASGGGGGAAGGGGGAAVGTGVGGLKTNNLCGEGGRNGIGGSVVFGSDENPAGLRIEDHPDLELGSQTHWTIEFWIFLNGSVHGDYDVVLGKGSGTGNNYEYYIEVMSDNTLDFLTTTAGTAWDFQQQITPVLQHDSWHHIALVRNGSGSNSLKSYVNGQEYGSFTAQNIHTSSYPFGIGYYAGYHAGLGLHANITLSNLRFCIGHAVYTSNFTPPTSPLTGHFTNSTDKTSLLCCQNSDNPLEENSPVVPGENLPKTITGFGRYEYLNDTELVTNGSGLTTTGWTNANTSTFTVEDGMIKVTRSGGTGPTAYQTITTVAGQQYTISANIQYVSGNYADLRVYNGSNSSGTLLKFLRVTSSGENAANPIRTTFTAESTSTSLFFVFDDGGDTGKFSSISVKAANRGDQPKVNPPFGTDSGVTFGGAIAMNSSAYMCFPTGGSTERGRGRALIGGGSSPFVSEDVYYVNIASSGRVADFGNLTSSRYDTGACSNGVRAVFGGGRDGSGNEINDTIDFVNIATTSNFTDFGNLTEERGGTQGAVSSGIRGIWGGGFAPSQVNKIEYVTIATTADAIDFGDLTVTRSGCGRAMSPTRGLFASGGTPSAVNTIDYITMATTGNATDFGDTTESMANGGQGTSSNTRGVFGGMGPGHKTLNFVTIASTGDATDFGDLRFESTQRTATGNAIRGIFAGGYIAPTGRTILIDEITIATTGNASAFGDLIVTTSYAGSTSDSHGGLS